MFPHGVIFKLLKSQHSLSPIFSCLERAVKSLQTSLFCFGPVTAHQDASWHSSWLFSYCALVMATRLLLDVCYTLSFFPDLWAPHAATEPF